jgi:G3E family GTPase
LTDGQVDDRAHADLLYGARIDLATTERTQLAQLDAEINKKIRLYELAQGRMNTARKLIRFDGNNGI